MEEQLQSSEKYLEILSCLSTVSLHLKWKNLDYYTAQKMKFSIRREQVNLLVYGPDRPYFKQK